MKQEKRKIWPGIAAAAAVFGPMAFVIWYMNRAYDPASALFVILCCMVVMAAGLTVLVIRNRDRE